MQFIMQRFIFNFPPFYLSVGSVGLQPGSFRTGLYENISLSLSSIQVRKYMERVLINIFTLISLPKPEETIVIPAVMLLVFRVLGVTINQNPPKSKGIKVCGGETFFFFLQTAEPWSDW